MDPNYLQREFFLKGCILKPRFDYYEKPYWNEKRRTNYYLPYVKWKPGEVDILSLPEE